DTARPEVTGDEELDAEAEETLEASPPPTAKSREDVTASDEGRPSAADVGEVLNGGAADETAPIDDAVEGEEDAPRFSIADSRASLTALEDSGPESLDAVDEEDGDEEDGDEDEPSGRLSVDARPLDDALGAEESTLDLDALAAKIEDDDDSLFGDKIEDSAAFLPSSPSLEKLEEGDDEEDEPTLPGTDADEEEVVAAPAIVEAPPAPPRANEPAPRPTRGSRRPKARQGREEGAAEARPPRAPLEPLPDFPGMPGFTITDPNAPAPRAPSPPRAPNERGARGYEGGQARAKRTRHRRGRDRDRGERGDRGDRPDRAREGREGRSRGDRSSMPSRISKSTPIREVVREGQEIIVQVTKDPIGTKGARCSSHVSLPGRYVVYLPTVDHIGISKRIGSEKERARLREAIETVKPPSGGLIVRTVAEGLTKKQLKQDVGYLVRLWGEIAKKKEEGARAPAILMNELDLVLKTARDLFTDEVHQIVIDDRHQYERLCRFVEMFAPDRLKDIICYSGDEPIFDAYGIEDEIGRALSRKVPLPSGGYLIIDQAEALTAIDVNTGRFVGKGSKDMEETILKTNLEAVHEIAYQLRFRNIGGLIILDLIDMERHQNREKVRRSLEEILQKDKAKTTLNRISDLGLIEMTRKRTRESLGRLLHEPCFYCDGTGQLQSKETIAYEILREIRRKRSDLPGYTVLVNAHPAVADVLATKEKEAVADAENRYMRKIQVVPRKEYHLEQFDLQGK
ncbi:MAG TPA: Rne/Rng family ribonuclease, partial [Polyangiaceae bacterium]|nr:Rne/Rng family ribonuclease [Polyangiaceae bacterium]